MTSTEQTNTSTTAANPLDLDAIKAREQAATKGPWHVDVPWFDGRYHLPICSPNATRIALISYDADKANVLDISALSNAAFIANARRDIPALLAEVERLRAQLDGPCGSCHPCTHYADETWRAAGRKPPHVAEWDDTRAVVDAARTWRHGGGDPGYDAAGALIAAVDDYEANRGEGR